MSPSGAGRDRRQRSCSQVGAGLSGVRRVTMGALVSARRPAGGRTRRALQERNWNVCLGGQAKGRLLIPQSCPDLLMNLTGSTGAWFLPLKLLSQRFLKAKTSRVRFGLIF